MAPDPHPVRPGQGVGLAERLHQGVATPSTATGRPSFQVRLTKARSPGASQGQTPISGVTSVAGVSSSSSRPASWVSPSMLASVE